MYCNFVYMNLFYGDVFFSVVWMEFEVVSMISMLVLNDSNLEICGVVILGGIESIFTVIRVFRDFMCYSKYIFWLEMYVWVIK